MIRISTCSLYLRQCKKSKPCRYYIAQRSVCVQIQDVEIALTDPNWTIFHAVQELIQLADLGSRQEKLRRIWEPTYTSVSTILSLLVYYLSIQVSH